MSPFPSRKREGIGLVKKFCFGEGVLLIRPSPCPLPARGEGVGLRPHTP